MSEPVVVVGLGAEGLDGLNPRALGAVRDATFLAGGVRNLRLVGPTAAETFPVTDNIPALLDRLAGRGPEERCVVLVTGDPLFYGIGHAILQRLGRDEVRVETAVSAMQRAFARVGLSWHDAAIASVHGRPVSPTLLPHLGRPKIGLFTRDGDSPAEVARFFRDRDLAGLYDAWVCEDLGSPGEAVTPAPLADLVGRRFGPLNVLILVRRDPIGPDRLDTADEAFSRPPAGPVLLTHQDVRALVVRRFRGLGGGPIWDVGAGLGGVTIELAREFPGTEVVAFERAPAQVAYLKTNRLRFAAYNARIVQGEAPGCLRGEAPPAGVFLGGSGGHLAAILDAVTEQLLPRGRLVANFVGLEHLTSVWERLRGLGWNPELTQVQVSEGRPLAGLTTLVPQRPVWVVRAEKP